MANGIVALRPAVEAQVLVANLGQTPMELNKETVLVHAAKQTAKPRSEVSAYENHLPHAMVMSIDAVEGKELTRRSVFTALTEEVSWTVNKGVND